MIASIELFEIFKTRFGEAEAKFIVSQFEKVEKEVETRVDKKFEDTQALFKNDITSLKQYMDKLFATKEDLANIRAELKTDIANSKADLIKWMFIFWASQLIAMITFLNFFK